MKTLEQIKNDYAKSKGYPSFNILLRVSSVNKLNEHTNELLILVQKECLKNVSYSVTTVHHISQTKEDIIKAVNRTKQSITNEKNIIK